jgi:hypothetical protein
MFHFSGQLSISLCSVLSYRGSIKKIMYVYVVLPLSGDVGVMVDNSDQTCALSCSNCNALVSCF